MARFLAADGSAVRDIYIIVECPAGTWATLRRSTSVSKKKLRSLRANVVAGRQERWVGRSER